MRRLKTALFAAIMVGSVPALAQQSASPGVTVTSLINNGYSIVGASTDGSSQFLYLLGTDSNKRKVAYACQIQFGNNGGFRGCLVLP